MKFELGDAIPVLERTPQVLRALLTGLPAAWLRGTEGKETWSAYQILGHLIHGEKTDWIPRTRMILEHGESRTFVPFDRTAMLKQPQDLPLAEMLDEFDSLRTANIKILKGLKLDEQQIGRKGRHPDFGPVTLEQLITTWVVHDLGHLAQITRVMAKQYTDEVGPWRAFLPVLDTRLK
ncbi:MAG TPA: DinB family protein [Acidobacteriota bacterium]|nr:DinB family protein [Acidobacteriota bacterium]